MIVLMTSDAITLTRMQFFAMNLRVPLRAPLEWSSIALLSVFSCVFAFVLLRGRGLNHTRCLPSVDECHCNKTSI